MANSKTTTRMARSAVQRSGARKKGVMGARGGREKKMVIAIALLAIALIGSIGVAVAAFSTDLYIRGTATLKSTVWNVHFANLKPVVTHGTYAKEITAPTIQTSVDGNELAAIKTYDVELKEPGDYVEYTFDVVNDGDLDAELQAIVINTGSALSCSSAAGQEAADKVCAKLNYTITYADGSELKVKDVLPKKASNNNSKTLKLKLEFDEDATEDDLPEKDVVISNLAVILTYGQKSDESTN